MPNSKQSKPVAKPHSAKPAKTSKPAAAKTPRAPAQAKPHPVPKHTHAKPAPAAKPHAPAKAKPHPDPKHTPAAKHAAAPKLHLSPKHMPAAKPHPAPKAAPAPKAPAAKSSPKPPAEESKGKAESLRARILERRAAKPIAFTLDEVREIAKTNVGRAADSNGHEGKSAAEKARIAAADLAAKLKKAAQPSHIKAASLEDILGYNPARQSAPGTLNLDQVDPKFHRFYKLLIDLRDHVQNGLNTHTEETLKRSAKDDSGDLSGYAQHMADAGTDTFDRDFALSLVSNEQEALAEIEAALQRIQKGTYGVCELTGKPINRDRLLAVPFARYSVESQAEVERTRRRSSNRAGLFGETGEDGGKLEDGGGGED